MYIPDGVVLFPDTALSLSLDVIVRIDNGTTGAPSKPTRLKYCILGICRFLQWDNY